MAAQAQTSVPAPNVVTTLETTKRSIYVMDPFQCLVVGIDTGDESSPGYDPRVKLPLDERMVESIIQDGVVRVCIARKDGERTIMVDGKRRVMHARAAILRMQAANPGVNKDDLPKVKVEYLRGDEVGLLNIRNITNAYAVKDSPFEEAKSMQKMLDKGADPARVALAFGVDPITVQDRLKLLDLAPEVVREHELKIITTNAALELSGIPMADQVKVLQKIRDEKVGIKANGKIATSAVANAVRAARQTGAGTVPIRTTPSEKLKAIAKLCELLAVDVGKSVKPLGKDGRTAESPTPEQMFAFLRKVAKLVHADNKSWDYQVKQCVPKDEDADLEATK